MGGSSKGLIDCRTLLGEHFGAALRNVQAILEADAELAVNRDGGFVAEAHAGLNFGFVSLHEIGPLMTVEPDAVAGAMRQAGRFITGSKSAFGDHVAGGRIDG